MNEELILEGVSSKLFENKLTYDDFEDLFGFLSQGEQYEVCNILYNQNIELVDACCSEETCRETINIKDDSYLKDKDVPQEENPFDFNGDESIDLNQRNIDIRSGNAILCARIQEGDQEAKRQLCEQNAGLVVKYAKYYYGFAGNNLEMDDLIQEGYIGLIKAANKFDSALGNSFSTYAVFWIKQQIHRSILDTGFMIRIPVHMMERIFQVVKLETDSALMGLSQEEKIGFIAEQLDLTIQEVINCMKYKSLYINLASLNTFIGDGEDTELIEFVEDKSVKSAEDIVDFIYLQEEINSLLLGLTEREEKVIRLRFGFVDGRYYTLEEVGQMFNVTRERIRQVEMKALRKLKHPNRSGRLLDFLEVLYAN